MAGDEEPRGGEQERAVADRMPGVHHIAAAENEATLALLALGDHSD
jgi:hypothetical protein